MSIASIAQTRDTRVERRNWCGADLDIADAMALLTMVVGRVAYPGKRFER
jgi:hypothetical protein